MLARKKHLSFILTAFLIVTASLFLSACAREGYQSPWGNPQYDPYGYDAVQAEKDENFPVFGQPSNPNYTPLPIDDGGADSVMEQEIPAPGTMGNERPAPYYKVDTDRPSDFSYSAGQAPYASDETQIASAVSPPYPPATGTSSAEAVLSQSATVKVGILLPLSGNTSEVGKALLNAMQLALFDIADSKIAMIVKDTKGTPEGARQAAGEAINDGAQILLGPLFSSGVKEVGPLAARYNINVLTFSTDWTTAGNNVYVMGFLPFTQVQRVVDYAAGRGYRNFAALSPKTGYGAAVVNTFQRTLKENNLPAPKIERFSPIDNNISPLVREFTDYDTRTKAMVKHKEVLMAQQTPQAQDELARIDHQKAYGDVGFDAVLLPVGGEFAKQMAGLFPYFEVDTNSVKLLGTGLWDDDEITGEMALQGAWFSAPDPSLRIGFERDYYATYSERPPRIATLGYDAMALTAVLSYKGMRERGAPYFSRSYLTNPNGYSGIDGIFRFRPDGLIERGLAVLEVQRTGARVIDPAPRSFIH